jgi:hypothetical protein
MELKQNVASWTSFQERPFRKSNTEARLIRYYYR